MEKTKKFSFLKPEVNMLEGSIIKGMLAIAMPIMIMNVLQSLFNIIDIWALKSFAGDENTVGAVGTCGTLISLITGLMIGCSAGSNVVIARNIGKGDKEAVSRAVGTSILFAIVGGVGMSILGVSLADVFVKYLMSCPPAHQSYATLYFRLYFAGVPISMVYNFSAAIMRANGDSAKPMIYLTLAGAMKVGLNILFVGPCRMSVAGVALATILSWSISATLGLITIIKTESVVKLRASKMRFYKRELVDILRVGIPTGLQQALYSAANVIITKAINELRIDEATNGVSIANNFDGILYQIAHAPSLAVMPYVSQNVGKGNIKRASKAVLCGIFLTTALGATFGSLSAIFSGQLSSIMSNDPLTIAYSQQKMMLISSTYFICGINDIFCAALRGMGRPNIPTASTLVYMCGIRFIWVYAIFKPLGITNLTFLYLIWPIGWTLSIITLLFFYFPTLRKLYQTVAVSAQAAVTSPRVEKSPLPAGEEKSAALPEGDGKSELVEGEIVYIVDDVVKEKGTHKP